MQKRFSLITLAGLMGLAATAQPVSLELSKGATTDPQGMVRSVMGLTGSSFRSPHRLATRAEGQEVYTIVDEDFSLMTKGSIDDPDTEYMGIAGEPYIDNALTHEPGWSCLYASQAGGAVAFTSPIGGVINTPEGDYSGTITISFRMKRLSSRADVFVALCEDGIWDPYPVWGVDVHIEDEEVNGEGELDENGWKEFSYTFENNVAADNYFIQFNVMYCKAVIDDIKVTSDVTGQLSAPVAKEASDFRRDGFTAHWTSARSADHYLFSLYSEKEVGPERSLMYEFNGGIEATDGWTLSGIETYTENAGYEGSGALVVDADGSITSPLFDERMRSASIWFRNIGDESYFGKLEVEAWDGAAWVSMGTVYFSMIATDEKGSYLYISGDNKPSFHDAYHRIRYNFSGFESDSEYESYPKIVVDHIDIETMPLVERVYAITDEQTTETSRVLNNLDPETDYYYEVKAVKGDLTALSSPMLAFGISSPVTTAASEITETSYTANWEYTPKATLYHVRDFGLYEALNYNEDFTVTEETFSGAVEGDIEDPIMLNNAYSPCYLNEYTDYPGWIGASTLIADGMIGCGGNGFNYIETPPFSLNNGNGSFTIEITVECLYGDDGILITPSSATSIYSGFEVAEGENTVTLQYENGSDNETFRIKSQYTYPFFIKYFRVSQDLEAGDKVYTYLASNTIAASKESYTFTDVDFINYNQHAYDVNAIYEREYSFCESGYCQRVSLGKSTGVTENLFNGISIYGGKGGVTISGAYTLSVAVYSIAGVKMAETVCQGQQFIPLTAGMYIVKAGDKTVKVLVK